MENRVKRFNFRQIAATVLLLLFAVFCLPACDKDFTKTSYATLATMGSTYEAVMKSAADAAEQNIIDSVQTRKIIDAANIFYASYHSATMALEIYAKAEQSRGTATREIVAQAIATAVTDFNKFIDIYNAAADGVKGISKWNKYEEEK